MTICDVCEQEMGGRSCEYTHVEIDGVEYERVRVQSVREVIGEVPGIDPAILDEPSCECGCEIGQVHHPPCDLETCPRCEGQFISCGCNVGYFIYYDINIGSWAKGEYDKRHDG